MFGLIYLNKTRLPCVMRYYDNPIITLGDAYNCLSQLGYIIYNKYVPPKFFTDCQWILGLETYDGLDAALETDGGIRHNAILMKGLKIEEAILEVDSQALIDYARRTAGQGSLIRDEQW